MEEERERRGTYFLNGIATSSFAGLASEIFLVRGDDNSSSLSAISGDLSTLSVPGVEDVWANLDEVRLDEDEDRASEFKTHGQLPKQIFHGPSQIFKRFI